MKKALEDSRLAKYIPSRYRLTSDHADDDEDEVGRQQEEYDNGVAVDIESFATTGHQELRRGRRRNYSSSTYIFSSFIGTELSDGKILML